MAEGSDEVTASEPSATEDLIEETERLLGYAGEGVDESGSVPNTHSATEPGESSPTSVARDATDEERGSRWWLFGSRDNDESTDADGSFDTDGSLDTDRSGESASASGSRLARLRPSLSVSRFLPSVGLGSYFSPRAYLAATAVLAVGLFLAGTVVPILPGLVGVFAVAFFVGLATSKRRYAELTAAGASVGVVAATLEYLALALVGGELIVLVGVGATTLAVLVGYYFGRDLRAGLSADID